MKRVLFIGITNYDFKEKLPSHLEKKFLGLSREINPYILARGRPFHKKIWNSQFYLFKTRFFYWLFAFFAGFYLCLFKKIDTIVAQSPLTEGCLGVFLKKIFRKELIVEVHGDWIEAVFLSKKRKFEKIQRKIVPILANFSLKRADKIRTISEYLTQQSKKIVSDKSYFIFPTFTDLDMFLAEQDLEFKNYILFVGVLEEVKGLDWLIESFGKIKAEYPDFKLIIVGQGSEQKNLESKIKSLELGERVEFKGKLSLKETKDIMKSCYCLVLPSRSEGLGRVIMEAQALSKPTIGSNVGGIPGLIKNGQNGFLFQPNRPEELAEALRKLLKDKSLAIEMGKKGREFIRVNFSNERYIKNYIQMIKL